MNSQKQSNPHVNAFEQLVRMQEDLSIDSPATANDVADCVEDLLDRLRTLYDYFQENKTFAAPPACPDIDESEEMNIDDLFTNIHYIFQRQVQKTKDLQRELDKIPFTK